MVTVIAVIGIVSLLAVGIFLAMRLKSSRPGRAKKTSAFKIKARKPVVNSPEETNSKWRAVKIKPGLICCENATNEMDKIYLAVSAPIFPLEQCTVKDCRCKYVHMNDRRDGDDRRETTEYLEDLFQFHEKERRRVPDRRLAVS